MNKLINYVSIGNGVPIIFIHGLSLNNKSNIDFFESIIDKNLYKRIYVDLPGMGKSNITDKATTDDILNSLLVFIKNIIGNQKFIIYGHSYGGYLALGIINKLKNQVLGSFITCPVITTNNDERLIENHKNIIKKKFIPINNQKFFNDFLSINVIVSEKSWIRYQKLIIPGLIDFNSKFINDLKNHYNFSDKNNLNFINHKTPIFILCGKNDSVVGYKQQKEFSEKHKNIRFKLINNSGHNLLIDKWEKVGNCFNLFLNKLI